MNAYLCFVMALAVLFFNCSEESSPNTNNHQDDYVINIIQPGEYDTIFDSLTVQVETEPPADCVLFFSDITPTFSVPGGYCDTTISITTSFQGYLYFEVKAYWGQRINTDNVVFILAVSAP